MGFLVSFKVAENTPDEVAPYVIKSDKIYLAPYVLKINTCIFLKRQNVDVKSNLLYGFKIPKMKWSPLSQ